MSRQVYTRLPVSLSRSWKSNKIGDALEHQQP